MPKRTYNLFSPDGKSYEAGKNRVIGQTHTAGKSRGVDEIVIGNDVVEVSVLPTRGMSLWNVKAGDLKLGWQSPTRGPVHPNYVPLSEPSGLGWLDGFDEFMVRCGLESNGAPEFKENGALLYPLHGKIGNIPAHEVTLELDEDEIKLTGVVEESRFHFQKLRLTTEYLLKADDSTITIRDTVENLSESPTEVQMLYHTNIGSPLLDAGSQLVVPAKTIVPRNDHAAKDVKTWNSYKAPEAGYEEQVYFFELFADAEGYTRAMLKNAHSSAGCSLVWKADNLPWFTQWKNTTALADGYVTGLEPATNFPNPRTFEGEQGRTIKLKGRAVAEFELRIEPHTTAAEVAAGEKAIDKIREGREPKVFEEPQEKWCAP